MSDSLSKNKQNKAQQKKHSKAQKSVRRSMKKLEAQLEKRFTPSELFKEEKQQAANRSVGNR